VASIDPGCRLRWRRSVAWRSERFGAILYDHATERLLMVRGIDVVGIASALEGKRPAGEELAEVVGVDRIAEVLEGLWSAGVLEAIDESA